MRNAYLVGVSCFQELEDREWVNWECQIGSWSELTLFAVEVQSDV